jgi:hypothetical protein
MILPKIYPVLHFRSREHSRVRIEYKFGTSAEYCYVIAKIIRFSMPKPKRPACRSDRTSGDVSHAGLQLAHFSCPHLVTLYNYKHAGAWHVLC